MQLQQRLSQLSTRWTSGFNNYHCVRDDDDDDDDDDEEDDDEDDSDYKWKCWYIVVVSVV